MLHPQDQRAASSPRPTVAAFLAIALTAAWALAACHAPAQHALAPLRIGTYQWPGSYFIDVAYQKGWFAEEGLAVERVDADNRYFQALDDVVAGKIDVMGFSQYDMVKRVAEGHDLVGVAAIDYSSGAEALIARPGIRSLRDLKGRRVALYRGSYLEYLLHVAGEREGVDVSDVILVDRLGNEALDDLKAGRVDALLAWEPYVSEAIAAGGVNLFSTAELPGVTYSVLAFRGDYLRTHSGQAAALMRVWDRAERWVREHPKESCDIEAALEHETPASSLELLKKVRILDLADNERAFSYAAGFESLHGSWRRMNDFMLENGIVKLRADSTSHLDSEFIRMLE